MNDNTNSEPVQIKLTILEKDYVLVCPEYEKAALLEAAEYLNQKVQEVKQMGKVVSTERLIALSALSIVHEYLQLKQQAVHQESTLNTEINHLQEEISLALQKIKQ